jgi:hypothetical protein
LAEELPTSGGRKGSGFGSVETNRTVEKAAIDFVRRQYVQDDWTIRSVEAEKVGCDLVGKKADGQRYDFQLRLNRVSSMIAATKSQLGDHERSL